MIKSIVFVIPDKSGKMRYIALRDEARRATIFYAISELSFDEHEKMMEDVKNSKTNE